MTELTSRANFVKICGITSVHDAELAIEAGADAIGLILAESSRRLDIDAASELSGFAKDRILRVGVFRGDSDDFVLDSVERARFDVVQIHGALSDSLLRSLRSKGLNVVKALSIDEEEFLTFDENSVDAVLIDGPNPGSGVGHSWDEVIERRFSVPVIAAGGLSPHNVSEVISRARPGGVDVSTGVESAPRTKDEQLVGSFVALARRAFLEGEN